MDYLKAFLIGGAICAVGQILIDRTKLTPARILVGYVVLGVLLGGVGVYAPFAEWAGAGATVPLTGFGNVLAQGTRKAIEERGLIGAITGPIVSGAAGIGAAIVAGIITAFITKPNDKNS